MIIQSNIPKQLTQTNARTISEGKQTAALVELTDAAIIKAFRLKLLWLRVVPLIVMDLIGWYGHSNARLHIERLVIA